MSPLMIKLEVISGTDIKEAAAEAVRVANLLGVSVEFDFNGIRCISKGGGAGKAEDLAKAYDDERMSDKKYKCAIA